MAWEAQGRALWRELNANCNGGQGGQGNGAVALGLHVVFGPSIADDHLAVSLMVAAVAMLHENGQVGAQVIQLKVGPEVVGRAGIDVEVCRGGGGGWYRGGRDVLEKRGGGSGTQKFEYQK